MKLKKEFEKIGLEVMIFNSQEYVRFNDKAE